MDSYFGWGTILGDGWRKGPWTPQEDKILTEHVNLHGEGRWNSVSKLTGLRRTGKSCRLRWVNYLRPDLKRGKITAHEESIIVELHAKWGNRWSTIARSLPGRTDNEIKNYWRTHFKKGKSTKNIERARARFLRQQQKQQQKQQQSEDLQYDQQQLQQQRTMNELDEMKSCMMTTDQVEAEAIIAQDIASSYYYCMQPLYTSSAGASEAESSSDDGSWGSLWNLDDVGADLEHANVMPPGGFMLHDQIFSLMY